MTDRDSERRQPSEPPKEQANDSGHTPGKRAKYSIYAIGLVFIIPIICMCLAIFALVTL